MPFMSKQKSKSRRRSDCDKKIKGIRRAIDEHWQKIQDALDSGKGLQTIPYWKKEIERLEQEIKRLETLRDNL